MSEEDFSASERDLKQFSETENRFSGVASSISSSIRRHSSDNLTKTSDDGLEGASSACKGIHKTGARSEHTAHTEAQGGAREGQREIPIVTSNSSQPQQEKQHLASSQRLSNSKSMTASNSSRIVHKAPPQPIAAEEETHTEPLTCGATETQQQRPEEIPVITVNAMAAQERVALTSDVSDAHTVFGGETIHQKEGAGITQEGDFCSDGANPSTSLNVVEVQFDGKSYNREQIKTIINNRNITAVLNESKWYFGTLTKYALRAGKGKVGLTMNVTHDTDNPTQTIRQCKPVALVCRLPSRILKLKSMPPDGSKFMSNTSSRHDGKANRRLAQVRQLLEEIEPDTEEDEVETVFPEEEIGGATMFHPEDPEIVVSFGRSLKESIAKECKSWRGETDFEESNVPFPDFRNAHSGSPINKLPSLPVDASLEGAYLVNLQVTNMKEVIPEWSVEGLKPTTHNEHLRYLKLITSLIHERGLGNQLLVVAVIRVLTYLQESRKWKWSTTLKAATSFQGALSLLPFYRNGPPLHLMRLEDGQGKIWEQAIRTLTHNCRAEQPKQPKPATSPQVLKAIEVLHTNGNTAKAAALLLGWLTAARLGCVLQLRTEDLQFNTDRSISITFRRGKGVRARGPYTVHATQLPISLHDMLHTYVETRAANIFGKEVKGEKLKLALRVVDKELEQRSIRRGALQLMALNGTPTTTLMRYSGHTRESTLLRYLDWGKKGGKNASEERKAGAILMETEQDSMTRRPISSLAGQTLSPAL